MQSDDNLDASVPPAPQALECVAQTVVDAHVKILTVTFDRSAAYTNLIIVVAYAGFFGLWQLTKDYLSKPIALWSALLMLVSIVTFVVFEVLKMVVVQHNVMERLKVLKLPTIQRDPVALEKAIQGVGVVHERVLFHLMRFWVVALVIVIASGMSATALLGYAFISGLAEQ